MTGRRTLAGFGLALVLAGCDGVVDGDGPTPPPPPPPDPVPVPLASQTPVPANYGIHDTFIRDGIAFLCVWHTGVTILDIGGGGKGGTPENPVVISTFTPTPGVLGAPSIHNAWWFHNTTTGARRYLFLGQEGPQTIGASSSGDIKVLDISNLEQPTEVAFFRIPGAGAHNFWMDEPKQILYAAFYNAGVVALDVSGVLAGDLAGRELARRMPGGAGNTYTWGVMLDGGRLFASDVMSGFWQLDPVTLAPISGGHNVNDRWGSDLWVRGGWAYTGTWGGSPRNGQRGDALKVWQLTPGGIPELRDSVVIEGIYTVSDLEVSDDGRLLVMSTEGPTDAGLYVFSLDDPRRPRLVGYTNVVQGIHTVSLGRVGTRLYAFAARNPAGPALQIYDLSSF